jgi:hypothetical protein
VSNFKVAKQNIISIIFICMFVTSGCVRDELNASNSFPSAEDVKNLEKRCLSELVIVAQTDNSLSITVDEIGKLRGTCTATWFEKSNEGELVKVIETISVNIRAEE